MSALSELARQQAVLAAWQSTLPNHANLDAQQPCWPPLQTARLKTDAAGLRAYQLNAQATAQRVLASAYPTIAAQLGADALDTLAVLLWRAQPPKSGDLGEWGGHLPALLATHPDLQAWPWLADSARLDWACHACERAADVNLDADSLRRLGDTDPQHLHLQLRPCVQVVASSWPIGSLWEAHQMPSAQQEQAAAQALALGQPETVVVWRQPWQVQVRALPAAQASWMWALHTNSRASLADLLDQANTDNDIDTGFDFTAWLSEALTQGWLWRVSVLP